MEPILPQLREILGLFKEVFEPLYYLTAVLGIPVGIYKYWQTSRQEQKDREYGTYNALDEKYIDYQKLCLRYPFLDVFDIPMAPLGELNAEQEKQELIAFTILFSIFERAFLMYIDQPQDIRDQQWKGWEDYIISYCQRDNFRKAWHVSGKTFDSRFQAEMKKKMDGEQARASQ